MQRDTDADAIVREIIARTGGDIRLALPLGLGKPVTLLNALVQAACDDPGVTLAIFTALTLERPAPGSDVERRFLEPAMDRLFGAYPEILYARLRREGTLPPNIKVSEFFMLAGRWLGHEAAQQAYISANYTHARDVLLRQKPNVLMQLVAEEDGRFSLSSNTDISADLFRFRAQGEADFITVFETHPQLPFLQGPGATLRVDEVDLVLDPVQPFELFSAPRRPLALEDHAIGLHVARLIVDGGTLQIGIGTLGDTVANALLLRDRGEAAAVQADCPFPVMQDAGAPFADGLYCVTEMLVAGLMALFEAKAIRREVDGCAIHAGFFVETRDFYANLRSLPPERRAKIGMMPVSFTNALYGDEAQKRAARTDARFVNAAMKVSALGDVMSDSVKDGQVVSGVGGQFNFIEQAFALDGARSIITLAATRISHGKVESNISWALPSVTVPRHMRDIVVTEYGIVDLRDRTDAEVIAALLAITDSRFQADLMAKAKAAGKLPKDYQIPPAHRRNLPQTVADWLVPHRAALPDFPFDSDFDAIERVLLPALQELANLSPTLSGKARLLAASLTAAPHPQEDEAMARMGYKDDRGLTARALRGALRRVASAKRDNQIL
ncbi:acetyl-CoA hydrolase/transferase C-terminal domain-containing protein [Pararhodobacter zhoushanensis]|uniref:Acetyl-CoA hydrolase/transferase C-terminal domain-containing protein n=1 Tax=Pararhodobacter zhoushanensis TaxID=2479545 RepID=A0ABT3H1I0_9RHOB|nr:acetyl-CoA hydrolase/transferase C-terminal domain-containing protein [Pararhodobacter zhoushanensis]MCW1933680.1 hypothetical protein [Pararhodobacter zhoushanensis]